MQSCNLMPFGSEVTEKEGLVFLRYLGLRCSFLFQDRSDGLGALRTFNKLTVQVELIQLPVSASVTF